MRIIRPMIGLLQRRDIAITASIIIVFRQPSTPDCRKHLAGPQAAAPPRSLESRTGGIGSYFHTTGHPEKELALILSFETETSPLPQCFYSGKFQLLPECQKKLTIDGSRYPGRRWGMAGRTQGRNMLIELGGCVLRDWRAEDAPALAGYANNRKIWCNLRDRFPHPYSLEDARIFIAGVLAKKPRSVFAIATSEEAIGSIGVMPKEDVHRFTAELGYWLAEPFWGKGIMTRAVQALVDHAFHEMKLQRIYAEPYATNPASARVLEKAGFILEGILHASVFKDGQVLDQDLYAVVSGENIALAQAEQGLEGELRR